LSIILTISFGLVLIALYSYISSVSTIMSQTTTLPSILVIAEIMCLGIIIYLVNPKIKMQFKNGTNDIVKYIYAQYFLS
jgi:hypothetical protein